MDNDKSPKGKAILKINKQRKNYGKDYSGTLYGNSFEGT